MSMVNDPIGDLLTRIRNAQSVRHTDCKVPYSKMKHQLCDLLVKNGWLEGVEVEGEVPKKELVITFSSEKPKLTLKRMSTPGRRIYTSCDDLKPVLGGYGIAVLTTSQGLVTDSEARDKKIGGEVLCTIS